MRLRRPAKHVIYDLDGVLLDTEGFYTQVTQEIVGRWDRVFDWSVKSNMIGRPKLEAARYLVSALDLPISAEQYLTERRRGLEVLCATAHEMPGAESFTRRLHSRGTVQAIATSTDASLFAIKKQPHTAWFSLFAAVVCGDDPRVHQGKPAPDIFLTAARDAGVAAEDCVVFEDSPAGVRAARAASMQVIALPDPAMDHRHYTEADLIAASFAELNPADLGLS